MSEALILRNVEIAGLAGLDLHVRGGQIVEIGKGLTASGVDELDGMGGALIPGLCDHHIHLFALAASETSVSLEGVRNAAELEERLHTKARATPIGAWIRAANYHEAMAGELTRADLDRLSPSHPIRIQHQTGALWMLNSAALDQIPSGDDPAGLDRRAGHLFRGDKWLRDRLGAEAPTLSALGARLAAYGLTAVTDASVTTDVESAGRLAAARRAGHLPQRLLLMSGGRLEAPADGAFEVGPVKILLDDHDLIDLEDFISRIRRARTWGRTVAVHCVTAAELALTLAAFEAAGSEPGDRIEHGGVIPAEAIPNLSERRLAVVTQPAFVRMRGDRYLSDVEAREQADLYRCASLLSARVPLAASSDAPYASPDPWVGIAAAVDRRTAGGQALGANERVDAVTALSLYLGAPEHPFETRRVTPTAAADLCLLRAPLADVLAAPSAEFVRATLVAGRIVHLAD